MRRDLYFRTSLMIRMTLIFWCWVLVFMLTACLLHTDCGYLPSPQPSWGPDTGSKLNPHCALCQNISAVQGPSLAEPDWMLLWLTSRRVLTGLARLGSKPRHCPTELEITVCGFIRLHMDIIYYCTIVMVTVAIIKVTSPGMSNMSIFMSGISMNKSRS